jgi:hypothetical protein
VRADLLAAAERAGGLTPGIAAQAREALHALEGDAEALLLTCSTLGPVVETGLALPVPLLRVDEALADEAVRGGGVVVVLCAVETTLAPTGALFARAAARTGATVEVRLVPRAWEAFKAGRRDSYLAAVAGATDDAFRQGARAVALAQASMAEAAALCRLGVPFSSPAAGLKAALDQAAAATTSRLPGGAPWR